jgi:hypothetical protein
MAKNAASEDTRTRISRTAVRKTTDIEIAQVSMVARQRGNGDYFMALTDIVVI